MLAPVHQSVSYVRQRWSLPPRVGIVLGTGLGNAAAQMDVDEDLRCDQIPHFPQSTALSHQGRLLCGRLAGIPTIAMAGRCHLYEGYTFDEITLPVRVMQALGARLLIVSNASGGLNPGFRGGEIMVITDHIDLMFRVGQACGSTVSGDQAGGTNGPELPRAAEFCSAVSPRTPRAASCYDPALIDEALEISHREEFVAHRGVYVAMTGPNYETRAEYRFLRRIGGDAVGMSTVPEVLVATRLGMRVLALSMIANVATPDAPQKVDAQQVVDWAARGEPNLSKIVLGIVAREEI